MEVAIYSVLYLKTEIWKINIDQISFQKIAQKRYQGLLLLSRTLLGLKNAQKTFQHATNGILCSITWKTALLNVDYNIELSREVAYSNADIELVVYFRKKASLIPKLNKWAFLLQISTKWDNLLRSLFRNCQSNDGNMQNFQHTITQTQFRLILYLCNGFRLFKPNFSICTTLLKQELQNKKTLAFILLTK